MHIPLSVAIVVGCSATAIGALLPVLFLDQPDQRGAGSLKSTAME